MSKEIETLRKQVQKLETELKDVSAKTLLAVALGMPGKNHDYVFHEINRLAKKFSFKERKRASTLFDVIRNHQ